jgi:antitoxin (DNA-binding transcriptional repressor) of toxin-antitoxin stability system
MITLTITELRRKFSQLLKRANGGERIAIPCRGGRVSFREPPPPERCLEEVFAEIETIRKRFRLPKDVTLKSMIEEGRTQAIVFEIAPLRMPA